MHAKAQILAVSVNMFFCSILMKAMRRRVVNPSPFDVAKLFIEQSEDQEGFFVDSIPLKGKPISFVYNN